MYESIREFGVLVPGADYVLRPGGYSVIYGVNDRIAVVSTRGSFYLPGGGRNAGKTAEDAAVREALEECGLRIRVVQRLGIADELAHAAGEHAHFRKRCTFFRAELADDIVGASEADHILIWLSAAEAITQLRHDSQRRAVGQCTA
jgi:8-oxo-dGTP pyrophosphatase MutT (NUDIX family)